MARVTHVLWRTALLLLAAVAAVAAHRLRGIPEPPVAGAIVPHAAAAPSAPSDQATELRAALARVATAAADANGSPKNVECPPKLTMEVLKQWYKDDPKGWLARAEAYQSQANGCLVRDVTAQASFKMASLSEEELGTQSLMEWTGGVADVVTLIQAAAAARSAAFQVFHVTLTAGGVGAATTFVGAAAFDTATGRHTVGLATATASGALVQQTKTTTYQCRHRCWWFMTCSHDCTRTDNIGDSPAQVEEIVADLKHKALQELTTYLGDHQPAALVARADTTGAAAAPPLGVAVWVNAPGQVASGPTVVEGKTEAQVALRQSVSVLAGLVHDTVQRLSKDSVAVAALVQGQGFDRLAASFTSGSFGGVPAEPTKLVTVLRGGLSRSASSIVLPKLATFAELLASRQLDIGEVVTMKLAWTMPSGTLHVALALAAQGADGSIDLVTSHGDTDFVLAPNLVVLQHCHTGFLLFKTCSTDVLDVPRSMTSGEAAWVADYTATAAVVQMAQVFGAAPATGLTTKLQPRPLPAPQPDTDGGTGDNKPKKDESMWDALKGALEKTAAGGFGDLTKALASGQTSSIGKQLVNGAGLASVHEAATMQKFMGVKDTGLELFAKLLPDMLDMADHPEMARHIRDRVLLASILDDSEWLKMGLAFKMDQASNTLKYATVMYSHNSTTSKSNWLVLQTEIEFALARYVYVVTSTHSVLGGLWSDSNDHLKEVSRGLTTADIVELMSFFDLAAMMSTAEFMGIPFKPPQLPGS